jgi:hypothetical protein
LKHAENATESALLGFRGRLRLSALLLRVVWTRRGREHLAEGGVEQLLVRLGLARLGLAHECSVAEADSTDGTREALLDAVVDALERLEGWEGNYAVAEVTYDAMSARLQTLRKSGDKI